MQRARSGLPRAGGAWRAWHLVTGLAVAFFGVFGYLLVSVGAVQAELAAALGLDLTRTGALGAVFSAGLGTGLALAGPWVDRGHLRPTLVGACALAALALASLGPGSGYPHLCLALGLAGLGTGAAETGLNAAIAARGGVRRLTAVHAAASVGAVLGPVLAARAVELGGWSTALGAPGWVLLAIALAALLVCDARPAREPGAPAGPRPGLRALLPFAVAVAAYVGFELALTVFATPYAIDALGLGAGRGRSSISALWLGLLLGRLGVLALPRGAGAGYLAVAGCGALLLVLLGTGLRAPVPEVWLAAVGLCLGGAFPVLIALAAARFPRAPGTAAGLVAAAGSIGGFAIPWITGAVGDALGAAAAIASLSVWCALLAGVGARLRGAS